MFYGDKNNWWACYAFWVFKLFGHEKCLLMNGGRKRWELDGRAAGARSRADAIRRPNIRPRSPTSRSGPSATKCSSISGPASRWSMCVRRANTPANCCTCPTIRKRERLRGGHIPGAVNIPWAKAANEDGTFKTAKELEKLYLKENGLNRRSRVVAYCRIGERSSHTWFVLKYLLGLCPGEKLRRLVDRMGQRGRLADRTRPR